MKNYEELEKQGLLIELPCKIGTTIYCIKKFCEKCTPKQYREEYFPFCNFENNCEYYEHEFYESAERCKEREEYDMDRDYCSLNLTIYCEHCKQRVAIQKDIFDLGKINRIYGTFQYDKQTPLEDTYFLTYEEAEIKLKELKGE